MRSSRLLLGNDGISDRGHRLLQRHGGRRAEARRHAPGRLRQRDRGPRLSHHARLRNGLGRHEHRVRPHRHHSRREVPPRGRRIVADLARRPALHVQAQEERPLPRRHQGRRRGGQVHRRATHGPRDPVQHAVVPRGGALGRGDRSLHRADQAQATVRVHAAHARRVPHGPRPRLAHRHAEVLSGGPAGGKAGGRCRDAAPSGSSSG